MQKTIFITGASSGLGKAAAKIFRSKGWHVIASMRNPEQETELSKLENITLVKLDITDLVQINETITETVSKYPVDVVLNNAGYGLIGPLEAFTDEQIIKQVNTNLLGTIRVTRAFIPYLRQRKQGMFLNITSTFGFMGYPTCAVYCATKFAIDGLSESLHYELAQFGIAVKVIAPGGIQTDFASRSMDGAQHKAYDALVKKVSEGYTPEAIAMYSTAEEIAAVIFEAATDGKNKLRYIAGNDSNAAFEEREKNGAESQVQKLQKLFMLS
jgi:NAD(P)-dependent dehydrogenase (short-subunit alcohol dehydrogenase family)